ncbi:SIKE family domain-containing protein [Ditylenchus destructor]|nr:SIKE family domain-containing protein [Ditylenchus destructor]
MGTKSDAVDNILHEMRQHVSGLQDKLSVAGTAVSKSQTVNEKIAIMKEYQDKVSTFNSCWRSKDRKNLVANLQHENRQMMALEEENRQLRFALKEMEDGLHLIMNDYRRVFSGFIRSDLLFDFAKQRNNVFMEMGRKAERCVVAADLKIAECEEKIAQLTYENESLRELVHRAPGSIKTNSDSPNPRRNSVVFTGCRGPPENIDCHVDDPTLKFSMNAKINATVNQKGSSPNSAAKGSSPTTIRWPVHTPERAKRSAIVKMIPNGTKNIAPVQNLDQSTANETKIPNECDDNSIGASHDTAMENSVNNEQLDKVCPDSEPSRSNEDIEEASVSVDLNSSPKIEAPNEILSDQSDESKQENGTAQNDPKSKSSETNDSHPPMQNGSLVGFNEALANQIQSAQICSGQN